MENKETGKPEEKILRQEEFKVDCPHMHQLNYSSIRIHFLV